MPSLEFQFVADAPAGHCLFRVLSAGFIEAKLTRIGTFAHIRTPVPNIQYIRYGPRDVYATVGTGYLTVNDGSGYVNYNVGFCSCAEDGAGSVDVWLRISPLA